jgi:hypothetical protein
LRDFANPHTNCASGVIAPEKIPFLFGILQSVSLLVGNRTRYAAIWRKARGNVGKYAPRLVSQGAA